MRHHIRCFESEAAYNSYRHGDDLWLPRVCFIPASPTAIQNITVNTPGRLVFHDWGEHFIEVANNGTMNFTDFRGTPKGDFYAEVDNQGSLNIHVPEDTRTKDGSTWFEFNSSTGELNFWNYPEDDNY